MIYSKHLTERVVLNMYDVPPKQVRAELVLMDPQVGDILINAFVGERQLQVEEMAGKFLRELGRLADDRPTISAIYIENHPLTDHIALADPNDRFEHITNPEPFDLLKVMFELEHEEPGVARTLDRIMVDRESFSQNHNAGHYAHGFNTRPVDPVYEDRRTRVRVEHEEFLLRTRSRSRRSRRARSR